jgi:zinc/manganese transport system ATP-binding protein
MLGIGRIIVGEVHLCGTRLGSPSPSIAGYLPQRTSIDSCFPLTVAQLVMMGLQTGFQMRPWRTQIERTSVRELADRLGIGDCLNHHISDLSGGQQQRAFLARALIAEPKLLVLDEPTSDVDPATSLLIRAVLDESHRRGTTIVLSTHDVQGLAAHLPEILCFNRGVVARGRAQEVISEAVLDATFCAAQFTPRLRRTQPLDCSTEA